MANLSSYDQQITTNKTKYKTFQGQKYLVAPVILVQEQVLNGELLMANELSKYISAWNGVPVTVPHPEDAQGNKISANSPDTLEKFAVGKIFNASYDKNKKQLKGEVWIDENLAKKIDGGKGAIKKIKSNKPLDVSTGYFSDTSTESGVFNGKKYKGKQYNLRPDHLALLPNAQGACGWKDGCGIRANEGGDELEGEDLKTLKSLFGRLLDSFKPVDNEDITDNEMSYRDIRDKLGELVNEELADDKDAYIKDFYEDYFIYEVYGQRKVYKRSYTKDDKGNIKLKNDATEVKEITEYKAITDIKGNELSSRAINSQLNDVLKQKFAGQNIYLYVHDIFSDYAIFKLRDTNFKPTKTKLYKISYSIDDNDRVSIGNEAEEVMRKVSYESIKNNKGGKGMKTNDLSREEIISNVLDNDCNKLKENTLKTMEDEELEFYANGLECNDEGGSGEEGEKEGEGVKDNSKNELMAMMKEVLEPVTNEVNELKEKLAANEDKEKEPYIEMIANSDKNPFEKKELKAMCVDRLQALSKAFSDKSVDFIGDGGYSTNDGEDGEDYKAPTVNDLKDKGGNK